MTRMLSFYDLKQVRTRKLERRGGLESTNYIIETLRSKTVTLTKTSPQIQL